MYNYPYPQGPPKKSDGYTDGMQGTYSANGTHPKMQQPRPNENAAAYNNWMNYGPSYPSGASSSPPLTSEARPNYTLFQQPQPHTQMTQPSHTTSSGYQSQYHLTPQTTRAERPTYSNSIPQDRNIPGYQAGPFPQQPQYPSPTTHQPYHNQQFSQHQQPDGPPESSFQPRGSVYTTPFAPVAPNESFTRVNPEQPFPGRPPASVTGVAPPYYASQQRNASTAAAPPNSAYNPNMGRQDDSSRDINTQRASIPGPYGNVSMHPYPTNGRASEPTPQDTAAKFAEMEQYNAPSYFFRSTSKKLPNSTRVQEKTHVPVGFVVQPLCPVPEGLPEVPVVNFGNAQLVRCKKCHAYVNPFVCWEGNGDRWSCNMCGNVNDTPSYYMKPLDQNGKRQDLLERPELHSGVYEIIASSDYMARPPQAPAFLFLIDVSANAVYCGLVEVACQSIKKLLVTKELPGGNRASVGIVTFDSTIHFYNVASHLSQPHMLVVPETDIFIPLPEDIMVNAEQNEAKLEALLNNLPTMWAKNTVTESCLGSAISASFMAMNRVGGKLCIFFTSPPSVGKFVLQGKQRSPMKQNATPADLEMHYIKPYDNSYKKIGEEFSRCQVSVDLFICPLQSVDLATISLMSKLTGGEIHYYPQFQSRLHGNKLSEELAFAVKSTAAWESVMRFRVSRGWKISKWFGHFVFRSTEVLEVANCKSSQSFSILLELDDNVAQDRFAFVQSALLYTNSERERRIRVHTYCLPLTHNHMEVSASMDAGVTASMLCQQAIEMSFKTSLADARKFLHTKCSQICFSQWQMAASTANLLAMYILGLLKSVAFRESNDVTADSRVFHLHRLETLPLDLQITYFYPTMISLHNLSSQHGTQDDASSVILPQTLNLTNGVMIEEGAYLLEDGVSMLMWIGRGISSSWLESVFGVTSLDYLHSEFAEAHIGASNDTLGRRVAAIINEIRRIHRVPMINLLVIKQGDAAEQRFYMSLIEDKTQTLRISLSEFLQQMGHRTALPASGHFPH